MKNKSNPFVFSGISFLAAFTILLYCLIRYNKYILVIIIVAAIFLATSYFFLTNIYNLINSIDTSNKMQLRSGLNDISSNLETINSNYTTLSKAIYSYTKKTYQGIDAMSKEDMKHNQQLITTINNLSTAQGKSTKILIKYNDSNTNKLISSIHDAKGSLSNICIEGFDQAHTSNKELIDALNNISIKTEPVIIKEPMIVTEQTITTEPIVEESVTEPEPLPMPDLSGDPNKQLSADDIAALFASMG